MPSKTLPRSDHAAIPLTATEQRQGLGPLPPLRRARLVVAVGLALLAPVSAFALELGEASIASGLGQALRVEIPYRLAAHEQLTPACVGLVPAAGGADALPAYTSVSRISISSTHIEIFDANLVREPLIGLNVYVHCDTAPHFVRSYQLFVDPPGRAPAVLAHAPTRAESPATAAASGSATSAPAAAAARANASPRARGQAGGNLAQGQTYRVARGDTLSGIAARVAERPGTIRQTADAIFAANPGAFTRGNRDLLKEGRSITIPILSPAAAAPAAPALPAPLPAIAAAELPAAGAAAPAAIEADSVVAPAAFEAPPAVVAAAPEPLAPAAGAVEPSAAPAPLPAEARAVLATDTPNRPAPESASWWWIALLGLGAAALLSAPFALTRRRKHHAAVPVRAAVPKPRPRRLVDPVAGISVVETRGPPHAETAARDDAALEPALDPAAALAADLDHLAATIGPIDSVDLDVGAPASIGEHVDWFGERVEGPAASADAAETIEEIAATAPLPDLGSAVAIPQRPGKSKPAPAGRALNDEQMTLTIVELDMLRQDYEAEHTLTQQGSQALRDALADLKATQAAREGTAATATLELPERLQADAPDNAEDAPTARLRAR